MTNTCDVCGLKYNSDLPFSPIAFLHFLRTAIYSELEEGYDAEMVARVFDEVDWDDGYLPNGQTKQLYVFLLDKVCARLRAGDANGACDEIQYALELFK
jgi:hypothetical protein